MVWTTYRRHLPALLIMIAAAGLWLALLPSLPDPMTVYRTFSPDPIFAAEPIIPIIAMCGFMLISHIVIVLIDLFLFAPVVPGYIMAAIDWIVEGSTAVFYLSVLCAGITILPFAAGLLIGAVGMFAVLAIAYRKSKESVQGAAGPLLYSPYFERIGPSLMTTIFFFLRPLFPSYIVIVPVGIRIIGILYDVTYPWERIDRVKKGDFMTFFSNRPVKLNQALANTVEIRLKDRKKYPVISVGDRDRFLDAAAQFMT
ncbi:MAG: hypothetical protein JW765_06415 [Deltaproteobacteria bacterium]|nr:hypothetical protein [Candidatus Zymogenaceae bacterium]